MKTLINKIVISSKFGAGIVIDENNGSVTIEFKNETKTLLLRFAGLTYEDGSKVEFKLEEVKPVFHKEKIKKQTKKVFATIEDLKEYKNLIIWYIKKFSYPSANVSVKTVMEILLQSVNSKEVFSKTKRGIKGAIMRKTKSITFLKSEENLLNQNGLEITDNGAKAQSVLSDFIQFKLNN